MNDLAKRIILKILSRLNIGRLIVIDGSEIKTFGNSPTNKHSSLTITIHDSRTYRMILFGGGTGAAEAYMKGHWSSNDMTALIEHFIKNRETLERLEGGYHRFMVLIDKIIHRLRKNTPSGSKKNIAAHYDLSNDFYKLWLDKRMMYSAAIFQTENSDIEDASENKLKIICNKLGLNSGDHLCEVGTGWGGMAIYAAKNYGCKVMTTTISEEQFNFASARIQEEGLNDKINIVKQDYRELSGTYSKLVSVEMIEAVGHEFLGSFFNKCNSLLQPKGKGLIQAITIADHLYEQAKHKVDFIQKMIFPGGALSSIEVLTRLAEEEGQFRVIDLESIGPHYAQTLRVWRKRFLKHIDEVKKLGFNHDFIRMWEFYFCYCEGGFNQKTIDDYHMVLEKK
jgi:cyclopropane-fatty-acyl-phospholipid synthase